MCCGYRQVALFYADVKGALPAPQYGAGLYTLPCEPMPAVSLTFGGKAFSVAPETFNLGEISPGSDTCVGGLAAMEDAPFWVVGGTCASQSVHLGVSADDTADVFLQNVYTAFDMGNAQVGFASLA